jgi:hypothetical protein
VSGIDAETRLTQIKMVMNKMRIGEERVFTFTADTDGRRVFKSFSRRVTQTFLLGKKLFLSKIDICLMEGEITVKRMI